MGVWFRRIRWALFGLLAPLAPALAQTQDSAAQKLLRQQERERVLRDIEQALENDKPAPTVQADMPIVLAAREGARPGESDQVIAWRQRSLPIRLSASRDDSGSKATGKLQGGMA